MESIMPCPFCASESNQIIDWKVSVAGSNVGHTEQCVTCGNCGSRGPNEMTEREAISMWNMRRTEMPKTDYVPFGSAGLAGTWF